MNFDCSNNSFTSLQLLKFRFVRQVRALVVLPTKDLSFQVYKVFKQYLIGTDLKAVHLGNRILEKEKLEIVSEGKHARLLFEGNS